MIGNRKSISRIEIKIVENPIAEVQFHPEIRIIYVLEGEIRVTLVDKSYQLEKDGIILVNSMIPYKIRGEEAIICEYGFSYQILTDIMKDEYFTFICNTEAESGRPYQKLREILNKMICNYLENQHSTNCLAYSLEYQMLDCLIEDFQIAGSQNAKEVGKDSSQRLQMIVNYVNMNYQHQISLGDLADRMFLSVSSISRFFKKETGIYFAAFVTDVRLHYAVKSLIYTEETITKVAVDHGFSNPSVFSKVFLERYQMSPSRYRKEMRLREDTAKDTKKEIKERLKHQLQLQKNELSQQEDIHHVVIESDVRQIQSCRPFWSQAINIGSAYSLTRANLQYHTLFLTEQLHFTHGRIWNIFSERMKIRKSPHDKRLSFDQIDTVLEFLVSNHIKPFLDFGMRPDCAIKTGKETVYFEEEPMEFQTMEEWETLIRSFMRHLVKRFGFGEMSQWIFEYSLDADHQVYEFSPGEQEYFEKYTSWYRLVRETFEDAVICGPGIIIDNNEFLFARYLSMCVENECVPDYITMLLFPYQSVREEDGSRYSQRISDMRFINDSIAKVKDIMKRCGGLETKLCISEWNSSISNRNILNDSCFRAAYIMKAVSLMWDKVDMACFWMGSDWISTYYDSDRLLQGGVGMITKDGIRKPAFYAASFLNCLGKYFVQSGNNYIITTNGSNSYYIICYHFLWYSSNYYIKGEDELDIRHLDTYFEKNNMIALKFCLTGVEAERKYTVKKRLVNEAYGSILQEWIRFNCETDLEGSDVKYLRDICIPHMSMEKKNTAGNILEFETELKAHEIALIHIYEDYSQL